MLETLIVMLPGALMSPDEYATAGFATALEQAWPEAELLPLAIDFNQMDVAVSVAALHAQLQQVRAMHARQKIILGGISIGAAIALHYARQYPNGIAGLCLIAPYPASRITTQTIRAAGGPRAWQISEAQNQDADFLLWDWMINGHGDLPIYLGHGNEDRFSDGIRMMLEAMPMTLLHRIPGGHDWPTWQTLWQDFVARRGQFTEPAALRKH